MNTFRKKKILITVKLLLGGVGVVFGDQTPELTPKQKKLISIVRKAINSPNSKLTVDPITGHCYSEINGYFIILTRNDIDIYGGYDSYSTIHYTTGEKLIKYFYKVVSERRKTRENKYIDGVLNKLNITRTDIEL